MCTHVKDPNWTVDLIWKYLHDTKSPGKKTGDWYSLMDPSDQLADRHKVYEMLVGDPAASNPHDGAELEKSMIPWNQQNKNFKKKFSKKPCGSLVKLTFWKYMGWGPEDPPSKNVRAKGFKPFQWIENSLRAGKPIRAHLPQAGHYVGIVGFRVRPGCTPTTSTCGPYYEFLILDPWAGGPANGRNTLRYGGGETAFLGVARQRGNKIVYDGSEIAAVEGTHPY